MKMKSILFFLPLMLGIALLSSLTASNARATNLLTNPDFDTDVSGWEDPYPDANTIITHDDTMDHDDTPVIAGSLKLEVFMDNGAADGPGQCFAVSPGTTYEASGFIYRPAQTLKPNTYISLAYYANPNCSFNTGLGDEAYYPWEIDDQWIQVSVESTVPEGVSSVFFRLLSGGTNDINTSTTVYFDHLYLPEPNQGALGAAALVTLLMLRSFYSGRRSTSAASALN